MSIIGARRRIAFRQKPSVNTIYQNSLLNNIADHLK